MLVLDKFLAPNTHEASSYLRLTTENGPTCHTDTVDESLMSGCASYSAFVRYIAGKDLFLLPRTRVELERLLRSYAYDAIHNAIAVNRSQLEKGGYSRICVLAAMSIHAVLSIGDNAELLLALHQSQPNDIDANVALCKPEAITPNHDVDARCC